MKNILLIYLNPIDWASIAAPPYGLEILASRIAKLPVNVIIENPFIYEDPVQYTISLIQRHTPDLIGFSLRNMDNMAHVWNFDNKRLDDIDSRCFVEEVESVINAVAGNTSADIICGGAGFSIAPIALLKRFNLKYGVKGPGEDTFAALVNCLLEKQDLNAFILDNFSELSGMVYADGGIELENEIFSITSINQDEIKRMKEYSAEWTGTTPVRIAYGCKGKCSYCVEGNKVADVNWRDLNNVIEEIMNVGKDGKKIWLACSEFNYPDESYAIQLCNKIIDNNINNVFSSYFLPISFSSELYRKLIQAGFVDNSICFGLTHVADSILKENNVPFRRKNIDETMDILCSSGAKGITIGFILGLAGETEETLDELAEWVIQTSKGFGKGFRCFVNSGVRIYPNTPMQIYADKRYSRHLYGQKNEFDLLKPLVFSDYLPPKLMLERFLMKTSTAEGLVSAYNMGNDLLKDQPEVFIYLQKAFAFKSVNNYDSAMIYLNRALEYAVLLSSRRQINIEIMKLRVLSKKT